MNRASDTNIPVDSKQLGSDTAVYGGAWSVATIAEGQSVPAGFRLDDPPSRAWFRRELDGWRIGASLGSPLILIVIPLILGIGYGPVISIYRDLKAGQAELSDPLVFIQMVFVVGAALYVFAATLFLSFGRTEVILSAGCCRVFTGAWRIGRTRRFDWSSVTRIEEGEWHSNGNVLPCVSIIGAAEIKIGRVVNDSRREYLVHGLRLLCHGTTASEQSPVGWS